MANTRITWHFYAVFAAVTIAGFVLHELAHWAMGEALGFEMHMSLNRAWPVDAMPGEREMLLISAAGPAFTIAAGVIAFWFAHVRGNALAYGVLFSAWFQRLAAMFVSLAHPNDEARISASLGLGMWTLPLLVVVGLLVLLWRASRTLGIRWRTNLALYALSSVLVAALVFADAALSGV